MPEYLRGYDNDGNEKLWIVTGGVVNSLALIDVNGDGKNEVGFFKMEIILYLALNSNFIHYSLIFHI